MTDELQKQGIEIVFRNRAIGAGPEEDLLLQMQGDGPTGRCVARFCILIDRVLIEQEPIRIVYRINFPFLRSKLATPKTKTFCTLIGGARSSLRG